MKGPVRFGRFLLEFRWGGHSLAALYLSILSGLVVAWQYNEAEPYYSSGSLELVVPFGSFWRACHFYASQLFFILLLLHFLTIALKRRQAVLDGTGEESRPRQPVEENWGRLYLVLPVALLLLFTGYVLRGDATGYSAGMIGEHITLDFPWLGRIVNPMLFNVAETGMRVVYANHLIGLVAAGGMLAWPHLRRYRIRVAEYGLTVAGILGFCLFVPAPFEPFRVGDFKITGPWFFIGIQELLRYLQPLWAGIVFPLIALGLGYQVLIEPANRRAWLGLSLWLLVYLALSLIGLP